MPEIPHGCSIVKTTLFTEMQHFNLRARKRISRKHRHGAVMPYQSCSSNRLFKLVPHHPELDVANVSLLPNGKFFGLN